MKYASGDDETDNKHLAEAIDVTREGSAPPGADTGYDDSIGTGGEVDTLRDSAFHVAITELEKIDSAPAEAQKEINEIIGMLRNARNADNRRRARVMAEAHDRLQDVWVPPT